MDKENLERIFNDDLGTSYFPYLAEEYMKDGEYDLAKKVCDIGMLLNPYNNDGKFILAKISMIHGDTAHSIKLLKEILDTDGLYVNAMKMLILSYQKDQRKAAQTMKLVHKILDLTPGDEFANDILKSMKNNALKTSTKKKVSKKTKKDNHKPLPNKVKRKASTAEIDIDSKMATLTFVDILIKQKQFSQANTVLTMVRKNKSISRDSINKRKKKIKSGLLVD